MQSSTRCSSDALSVSRSLPVAAGVATEAWSCSLAQAGEGGGRVKHARRSARRMRCMERPPVKRMRCMLACADRSHTPLLALGLRSAERLADTDARCALITPCGAVSVVQMHQCTLGAGCEPPAGAAGRGCCQSVEGRVGSGSVGSASGPAASHSTPGRRQNQRYGKSSASVPHRTFASEQSRHVESPQWVECRPLPPQKPGSCCGLGCTATQPPMAVIMPITLTDRNNTDGRHDRRSAPRRHNLLLGVFTAHEAEGATCGASFGCKLRTATAAVTASAENGCRTRRASSRRSCAGSPRR